MLKTIRNMWPLLLLGFLVNTAYSVMWPLTTIYLHNDLHLNLVMSGWVLAAYSGCNVLGGYLGGIWGDRWTIRRVGQVALGALLVDAIVGFWWNDILGYPVVLVIFGFLTGAMLTLVTTLTAQLSHTDSRLFNLLYIFINLGLVVGTASIGVLFRHSLQPIFGMLVGCYLIAIFVWWRYIRDNNAAKTSSNKAVVSARPKQQQLGFVTLIVLFAGLFLMWMTYSQWMSNVSIYIQQMGMPIKFYSYLWAYNGLLLIIIQAAMMRISRLAALPWEAFGGILAISLSFLVLSVADDFWVLFVAMTLLTAGEAIFVPSVPMLINAYTVGKEGMYQGLVNAFSSLGKALGPVLGGWIIDYMWGFKVLFLICMGANLVLLIMLMLGLMSFTQKKS